MHHSASNVTQVINLKLRRARAQPTRVQMRDCVGPQLHARAVPFLHSTPPADRTAPHRTARPRGPTCASFSFAYSCQSSCPADPVAAARDQTFHFIAKRRRRRPARTLPRATPAAILKKHPEFHPHFWRSQLSICLRLSTLFLLNQADIMAPNTRPAPALPTLNQPGRWKNATHPKRPNNWF